MMKPRIFLLGALLALSTAHPGLAQSTARVAEAQKAYADVDYEGTRRLAQAALERGGNDRAATGQLYLLWAMAAAALDHNDEARSSFSLALALNPQLKLDRGVSPKIRGPYLEARGALSSADGQAPLEVKLQQRRLGLEVALRDSLGLAASIELLTRSQDREPYTQRKLAAAATRRVELSAYRELQAFLRVLDRYGNVVAQLGSAEDPERLALVGAERQPAAPRSAAAGVDRTPYLIGAGALAVLGLASGGVATALYLKREDAAKQWNGASCELPGMTRQQQCSAVDDRRQRAENLAIGFGVAGGALLVGSAVSLLLAPASKKTPTLALDAGPQSLMLQLGGRL
jgi:hypothetical protein